MSGTPEPTKPAADEPRAEDVLAPTNDSQQPSPSNDTPPPKVDEISPEAHAAMDAAMHAATEQIPVSHAEVEAARAAAQAAKPRPIRGPRVVQGGREHRTGVVVSVGPEDIFIEFGPKELGVLPKSLLKEEQIPKTGGSLEVVIERFEPSESIYICTMPGAVQKADWELLEKGQVVDAMVTGVNKGGLELEVAQHRAFMPASQVDIRRIDDLTPFIGQKLTCKVTRVDRSGRGNITLSRRDIVAAEQKELASKLKDTLKEGDEIEGVVRKIMPFGAFVDMGGTDGLLHVSDISHDRVSKVEDHLKEGDTVRVKILKLDWESGRHSLGLKQLAPDPWEETLKDIKEGETATGIVTKLLEFGCFVQLADGIEGLVHISELDWKRVQKTSDVVQPNKTVKVKVLKIDSDSRKISLSIKQATDPPANMPGRGGKPGGRGRKGEEPDTRTPEEIKKETPEFRRLREKAKLREKELAGATKEVAKAKESPSERGGLGSAGGLGIGLGDLKL
mgnify:CR=1 FL=1